jgi:hypothetical protein
VDPIGNLLSTKVVQEHEQKRGGAHYEMKKVAPIGDYHLTTVKKCSLLAYPTDPK